MALRLESTPLLPGILGLGSGALLVWIQSTSAMTQRPANALDSAFFGAIALWVRGFQLQQCGTPVRLTP
jgi:hypothetical protein